MSEQEGKHYYSLSPQDAQDVLDHKKKWTKINVKAKDSEEWSSAGYFGWAKSGKNITIMIADKPKP